MNILRAAVGAAMALACAWSAAAADLTTLLAGPVPLYADTPERRDAGRLVYRGGLVLSAMDDRFGGWSDLSVSEDGSRLTAISDNGYWFDGDLRYDLSGALAGLAGARFGGLTDPGGGTRAREDFGDAEGLATAPDGTRWISFERRHRIWRYPPSDPPFTSRPTRITTPELLQKAPRNGGLEALLRLTDGRMLAITEDMKDAAGERIGWILEGETWSELRYRPAQDFSLTSLAQFPGGDVLALERSFALFGGFSARLVRLRAADIVAGAHLAGEEIATFKSPMTVDNFEGVAVARGPEGALRIYLLSDDNYSFLQRTLLLMFELK